MLPVMAQWVTLGTTAGRHLSLITVSERSTERNIAVVEKALVIEMNAAENGRAAM